MDQKPELPDIADIPANFEELTKKWHEHPETVADQDVSDPKVAALHRWWVATNLYNARVEEARAEGKSGPRPLTFYEGNDEFSTVMRWYGEIKSSLFDEAEIDALSRVGPDQSIFALMSRLCVAVPGGFMIRNTRTQTWEHIEPAHIVAALNTRFPVLKAKRTQMNDAGKVVVKPTYPAQFIKDNLYPYCSGVMRSVNPATMVEVDGDHHLNLGIPPIPEGRPDLLDAPETVALWEMILRNFLGDDRDLDTILAGIKTITRHPTTQAIHWLAHVRQRPYQPVSTCLWLHSFSHGIGKSSFVSGCLGSIVAGFRLGSPKEVASDWDDWPTNQHLCFIDEPSDGFSLADKGSMVAFIKRHVGNTFISPRRRHVGSVGSKVRATASFILCTNQCDYPFEQGDRRNIFISGAKATEGEAAKARLSAWIDLGDEAHARAFAGFAAFLDDVEINDKLLREAIDTPEKYAAAETHQHPFLMWLDGESRWLIDHQMTTHDIDHLYGEWCVARNVKVNRATSAREGLSRARSFGYVSDQSSHKRRNKFAPAGQARAYTLLARPNGEADDKPDVIEQIDGIAMLDRMRDRMNQRSRA